MRFIARARFVHGFHDLRSAWRSPSIISEYDVFKEENRVVGSFTDKLLLDVGKKPFHS